MSEGIIDSFFDLVSRGIIVLDPNVTFVIYGGEPLLNPKILHYFLEKRKILPKSQCSIVTNAVLLDNSMIDYLKKENVNISISIDGPKEITDAHRKFRNSDRSVFNEIKDTINRLKILDATFALSITITYELMENKNSFWSWLEKTKPKAVAFNLLKLTFNHLDTHEVIEYYRSASDFLIEAHMKMLSMGIVVQNLTRLINLFVNNQIVFADCEAPNINQLTFNANGDLYSCQCYMEKDTLFGNVNSLTEFNIPTECSRWFDRLPVFKETRLQCLALPICGGGCLVQGRTVFKNAQYIDDDYCEHIKNIMNWLLKRIYLSTKGGYALEEKEEV